MLLSPVTAGPVSLPSESAFATPAPPARWSRFYTSPIARVDYGTGSRVPLWGEATIPSDRSLTGQLQPGVTYAGATLDAAIEAARLLSREPVELSFSFRNGRTRTVQVNPAIAVLRDAKAGAFWLAPLRTTVRLGDQWLDAPHSIDGPAFEGADAVLTAPTVLSATRDMVAVVGRDLVLKPGAWTDAPDESRD
ncbi:MAG: hypothetical protein JWL76_95 [Thermoleophilia bacterium]|nr:hypothetical protein [Thermoleophilia bacterium]